MVVWKGVKLEKPLVVTGRMASLWGDVTTDAEEVFVQFV